MRKTDMARSQRGNKKETEQDTMLGLLIKGYDYRVEAGINKCLKMQPNMAGPSCDPLYTYSTTLDIKGNCIYPDERMGGAFQRLRRW